MINFNSLNYWNLWTVASSSVGAHFTKIRRPRTNVSFVPLLTPWFLTLILTIYCLHCQTLPIFLLQYLKCRTYLIEPILFNYDQFMERIQLIFLQVNHFIECTVLRLLIIFFLVTFDVESSIILKYLVIFISLTILSTAFFLIINSSHILPDKYDTFLQPLLEYLCIKGKK